MLTPAEQGEAAGRKENDLAEFQRLADSMLRTIGERFTGAHVPEEVIEHFAAGVLSAHRTEAHRADPMFSLGSEETYDVYFSDGSRFLLTLWGNQDGWGITVERAPSHVPAVADVIRVRRERNCSQDEAVIWLGGTP